MNIDQQEVQKFADLAEKWWDISGDFKPLHVINPLRAEYISSKVELEGKTLLDVGCGGGLHHNPHLAMFYLLIQLLMICIQL